MKIVELIPIRMRIAPTLPWLTPFFFSILTLIQSFGSTDCKPYSRDSGSNLVWVTQEVLIPGSWKKLTFSRSIYTNAVHAGLALFVCFQENVFSHPPVGLLGRVCSQMASQKTAAQTAEVCSCGVPLTESYRDHIVWT